MSRPLLVIFLGIAVVFTGWGSESGPVVVVPLRTEVSSAQFYFLRRALKEAERDGASAFVIDMETYGGEAKAAVDQMDALLKTSIPTYAFINNKAISAGALIALATKHIYMSPNGVIGAAAPVLSSGEDQPKIMQDKTVSMLSAVARAAAQQNGHRPELADSFIRKEAEIKISEEVIDRPDTLLTLSAQEAARVFDGKPLLATGIVSSLEEMLQKSGLKNTVRTVDPSGFERLAIWITALAPLLLLGGVIGAYVEFKTPGFGIPGILSAFCFTLFFTGHYLAGLSGWEAGICFGIGLLLVIFEFFVFPGLILPGLIGALLMVGAMLWAMVDRYPSEPWWPTGDMLTRPLVNFSLAMLAAAVAAVALARILPKTALYRRIVLTEATPSGPGITVPIENAMLHAGESGSARTDLRPAGKADFAGRLVDVVSQGDWVESGTAIRVCRIEGTRVVVERA